MNDRNSIEYHIAKQTCRLFAYKYKLNPNTQDRSLSNKYSMKFLKIMHDSPKDNLYKVIRDGVKCGDKHKHDDYQRTELNVYEKAIFYDYFKHLNEIKSNSYRQWTDLQHYLLFIYRFCIKRNPDQEQEGLSYYFISDMRNIACGLMEDDQIQLCLRMFSLIREYTIFAQKQFQKVKNTEQAMENLFYYYEAFLSAAKNICKIFPELEKLLLTAFKLGWLDFNKSIFMCYFYETNFVQHIVREFESKKANAPLKTTRIYTVITELYKLWKSQMQGVKAMLAGEENPKTKNLENLMVTAHKWILSKNFWIDRTLEEKLIQDLKIFDRQLFTLVGDKSLVLPEPILNEYGQCNCEDCLIIMYRSQIENLHHETKPLTCRFCKQEFAHFHDHLKNNLNLSQINSNPSNISRIITENFDLVKLGLGDNVTNKKNKSKNNNDMSQDKSMKNDLLDNEVAVTKLEIQEYFRNGKCDQISNKTLRKFFKLKNQLTKNGKENLDLKLLEKANSELMKIPTIDLKNDSRDTNSKRNYPCGHSCKDDTKSDSKKGHHESCDHFKESKNCNCTLCEVFGTSYHVHKTNETRNRLRIRLNQRNEKITNNKSQKTEKNKSDTKIMPDNDSQSNDIHGILNFIEGNTSSQKLVLAEKKAAKKARQRVRKEQERLELEEKERKRLEEEERLRREEAKKKAQLNDSKKKKKKSKNSNNEELVEETIPAMVTIKRVVENHSVVPTVTITLKGSTPDQDKLLYKLVNGHTDGESRVELVESKKNTKKGKNQQENNNNSKKKHKIEITNNVKELRVTLEVDSSESKKIKKKIDKKVQEKEKKETRNTEINLPMLKLPPGITITKVDGPMTDRNYKTTTDIPPYNANIPVSKSGVIVVDTEKLIKQASPNTLTNGTKKNKKKKKGKKDNEMQENTNLNKSSMVTLKNPIFQSLQTKKQESDMVPELSNGQCQQAAIFKNENGMVTIRSSRLQQSMAGGAPMPNLLSDLKPVLGPEVPSTYMSSCNFESNRLSSFNAQEILSGLPGIEITKVDKNTSKNDVDCKKSCHTAEVSIIPTSNGADKFNFDKEDWHYDSVFTPKDILEDDMDAEERELEAFKRFCQQSVPPKRKEKVAHLNVKDIVLKKKNDKIING